MKKTYLLTLVAILCYNADVNAQGWLRQLSERAVDAAQSAAERKVLDKVERDVENAIDAAINGTSDDDEAEEQSSQKKSKSKKESYDEDDDAPASSNKAAKNIEANYAKSDFVPGDEVFFDDPMEGEQMGEFPSKWDLIEGEAEVAKIEGKTCISMRAEASTTIEPLMDNQKSYLPDVFTVEFDFYRGKTDSSMGYIVRLANDDYSDAVKIVFSGQHTTDMEGNVSYLTPTDEWRNSNFTFHVEGDSWNHLSISFNKRALKVYINGNRVANIPNCVKTNRLFIEQYSWGGFDDSGTNAVTNVKLCKGAVPLYDRLSSQGKIITYAITFETGKADLKPESMTEINRIAKLMNEQSDLKFEVQGHCDNQGSDKVNDPLSQKRAEAIVAALVKQGINASRLTAVGKGSHSPIADNSTDEGRAKNRRVEFVKK